MSLHDTCKILRFVSYSYFTLIGSLSNHNSDVEHKVIDEWIFFSKIISRNYLDPFSIKACQCPSYPLTKYVQRAFNWNRSRKPLLLFAIRNIKCSLLHVVQIVQRQKNWRFRVVCFAEKRSTSRANVMLISIFVQKPFGFSCVRFLIVGVVCLKSLLKKKV